MVEWMPALFFGHGNPMRLAPMGVEGLMFSCEMASRAGGSHETRLREKRRDGETWGSVEHPRLPGGKAAAIEASERPQLLSLAVDFKGMTTSFITLPTPLRVYRDWAFCACRIGD